MNPIKIEKVIVCQSRNDSFSEERNKIFRGMVNHNKIIPRIIRLLNEKCLVYYDPFAWLQRQQTVFLILDLATPKEDYRFWVTDWDTLTIKPAIGSDSIGGVHHYIEKGYWCINRKDVGSTA